MTPILTLLVRGNKITFIRAANTLNEREEFLHTVFASILLPQFEDPQPVPSEELRRGPQPGDRVFRFYTDGDSVLRCATDDDSDLADRLMDALNTAFNMAASEEVRV